MPKADRWKLRWVGTGVAVVVVVAIGIFLWAFFRSRNVRSISARALSRYLRASCRD